LSTGRGNRGGGGYGGSFYPDTKSVKLTSRDKKRRRGVGKVVFSLCGKLGNQRETRHKVEKKGTQKGVRKTFKPGKRGSGFGGAAQEVEPKKKKRSGKRKGTEFSKFGILLYVCKETKKWKGSQAGPV